MPASQPEFIPFVDDVPNEVPTPHEKNYNDLHGGKKRRENPAKATELNYSRNIISRGGTPWKRSDYPHGVVG